MSGLTGCSPKPATSVAVAPTSSISPSEILDQVPAKVAADSPGRRVLVVVNSASPESVRIGTYYAKKRGVPKENFVVVKTTLDEEVSLDDYKQNIEGPVMKNLFSSPNPVDFIVVTKGLPIRFMGSGFSMDGWLGTYEIQGLDINHPGPNGGMWFVENPYFGLSEPFSHKKFHFYLVTRLDGYTEADAIALVDHSMKAQRERGPFLLDQAEGRDSQGYAVLQAGLATAAGKLQKRSLDVIFDSTPKFVSPDVPLEGYASWGSNDSHFDETAYHHLTFKPGAIAETFVSTSARTFRPTTGGQSLIADLIHQGVTGVKGYVSEPYTFALARPEILFDRYAAGFSLAESFYMASPTIRWKETVIGDPLCSPFAWTPISPGTVSPKVAVKTAAGNPTKKASH